MQYSFKKVQSFISEKNLTTYTIKSYLKFLGVMLVSVILSSTALFSRISPFPAAFIGSLSGAYTLAAFAGSVGGFLLRGNFIDAIPTMTALLAVGMFRVLTSKWKGKSANIAAGIVTGFGVFITTFLSTTLLSDLFISAVFGVIGGVTSYCLITCYNIMSSERTLATLKPANTFALGTVFVFGVSALSEIEFGVINMGFIAGSMFILSFGNKYRYSGAAVCGTLAAFGISLINENYATYALIMCIAGIISALFVRLGKFTQLIGFISVSVLGSAFLGITKETATLMLSLTCGGLLFILFPMNKLLSRFHRRPVAKNGADPSEIFSERLRLTGMVLGDVKDAIEKTSEVLDKRNAHSLSWVYTSACDHVCKKCRQNMHCWGENYNNTTEAMETLLKSLRQGKTISVDIMPERFKKDCIKREYIIKTLNDRYREYVNMQTTTRKISEMRGILTAQLGVTETLMEKMADEFIIANAFDRAMGAKVEKVLISCGILEVKAGVLITMGRVSVEAYGKGKLNTTPEKLCNMISAATKTEFDLPDIVVSGKDFRMTMYERSTYAIEYGAHQISRAKEKNCGDYYESFVDNKGYAYIVLSDGMGSGSRARIDSAFACGMLVRLIRTGVNLKSAIEIVNNSLLVKSADESFATLDICKIDLYTGRVELYKAGGAASYIKCSKKVVKAAGRGMPVGIYGTPNYEAQSFMISTDDIIIMTSDGADINESWLEFELNKGVKLDMDEVAENIASAAKFAAEKGKEDDISVVAVKLVK